MLMLDNGGNLNNTNDAGQTPLAFACLSTLKKMDLENGIATTQNSSIPTFDNNKCLIAKKPLDIFKSTEFCNFQLDKMVVPSEKVRMVDNTNMTHLVSFDEKTGEIKQKECKLKLDEQIFSEVLPSPSPQRQQSMQNSPLKKRKL